MVLFTSSPSFSTRPLLSDESTVKTTNFCLDDEFEITSYLASGSDSEPSSRASSPYPESVTSLATPCLSDDRDIEPDSETYPSDATFYMMNFVGIGIDPSLLSGTVGSTSTIIQVPAKCEVPPGQRRIEARKASSPAPVDDSDFEPDGTSDLDDEDDEYISPEDVKRNKRVLPSKHYNKPIKKPRTQSTLVASPDVTIGNPKHRARNLHSSSDAVKRELERIERISVKKKTNGRKNKDLSCWICRSKTFKRQSDLRRHVLTHNSLHTDPARCCGISPEQAVQYNIDPEHFRTYHLEGELRIGACGIKLSRSDALLRHVKLPTSKCLLLRAGQVIGSAC